MRVDERPRLIADLGGLFKALPSEKIERLCVGAGLPFAFVGRPEDLFDDPHLNASGGLLDTVLQGDVATKLPALPLRIDGQGFPLRSNPPAVGENNIEFHTDKLAP